MKNKKLVTKTCSRSSRCSNEHDKRDRKELSVISENEFNDSNTDIEDENSDEDRSDNASIEYKLRNHDVSTQSIVTQHTNVLKNVFDKVSSAMKFIPDRHNPYESDSSLFLSNALKQLNNFVHLAHNIYWADKLLLELTSGPIGSLVSQALLPQEHIFENYDGKKSVLAGLNHIIVAIPNEGGLCQKVLQELHSIAVPPIDQNGIFVNSGSCVTKMCWATIHPDLHRDQYLAVAVNGGAHNETDMIQLYRCDFLITKSYSVAPPDLEYLLVHRWGKVTDMCWCPQPLPVIARQVPLIGHLALACVDGFVRILPITRRGGHSNIITVAPHRHLLCLGPKSNMLIKGMFPTCITWCKRCLDRIIVGYNSGQVAMFLLDSNVMCKLTMVIGKKIQVLPLLLRQVFPDSIRSVQISPNDSSVVACTSFLSPHALLVDFSRKKKGHINLDLMGIVGATLLWPFPGDFVTLVGGLNPNGIEGLLFMAVHKSTKSSRKVPIKNVSVAELNASLNVMSVGTRLGQLLLVPINSIDIKGLHRKLRGSKIPAERSDERKFYHQYKPVPIFVKDESTSTIKPIHGPSERYCVCPPAMHCVHRLITEFSISVSKEEDAAPLNWQLQEMLNINGMAVNPNPGCCAWVAVSLQCGLIHLVPLTPFYDSECDRMTDGQNTRDVKRSVSDLFDEELSPLIMSHSALISRHLRFAGGVSVRQSCRETSSQSRSKTRNNKTIVSNKTPPYVSNGAQGEKKPPSLSNATRKCDTSQRKSRKSSDESQQCTKVGSENSRVLRADKETSRDILDKVSVKRTTRSSMMSQRKPAGGKESGRENIGRKDEASVLRPRAYNSQSQSGEGTITTEVRWRSDREASKSGHSSRDSPEVAINTHCHIIANTDKEPPWGTLENSDPTKTTRSSMRTQNKTPGEKGSGTENVDRNVRGRSDRDASKNGHSKQGSLPMKSVSSTDNTSVNQRDSKRITRSSRDPDVAALCLFAEERSVKKVFESNTVTKSAKRCSDDTTREECSHGIAHKRRRKVSSPRKRNPARIPSSLSNHVCLEIFRLPIEDIVSMDIKNDIPHKTVPKTAKDPLKTIVEQRVLSVDIDSEVATVPGVLIVPGGCLDLDNGSDNVSVSTVQSALNPVSPGNTNIDYGQSPRIANIRILEDPPTKIVKLNCDVMLKSNDIHRDYVKEVEMKRPQGVTDPRESHERSSCFRNASWWDSDNTKSSEEHSFDVTHIDDLSIVRSTSQSTKCRPSLKPAHDDELKKIHTILTKGILQDIPRESASPPPKLLQPFHSLKLNKSLDQWN